jgi:hypothetical protein
MSCLGKSHYSRLIAGNRAWGAAILPCMYRWTARLLMLVMLVPAFGPAALARGSEAMGPHCMRHRGAAQASAQPKMECHGGMAMPEAQASAQRPSQVSIGSTENCCQDHSCCRGLTASRWAQPRVRTHSDYVFLTSRAIPDQISQSADSILLDIDSARAPPLS